MKNRLKLLIILAIVHFSFAQETANICNANNFDATATIPLNDCEMTGLKDYFFGLQKDVFFIHTNISIPYKSKSYKLRFFVTKDASNYNAMMAIVQTAYASRSKLNVIYPNPSVISVIDLSAHKFDNDKCGFNNDGLGNPAHLYCPIESITVKE